MKPNGTARFVFLFCFWPLCALSAASVQLTSGETYDGKVVLDADAITVTPDRGAAVKIDAAKVFSAVFAPRTKTGLLSPGVVLTNGSLIVGPVDSIPAEAIALILFNPVPRGRIADLAPGRTGAILTNGDFFAGSVEGLKDYSVAISSPVFGLQRFELKSKVMAVVIRDVQNSGGRYAVSTKDGSYYLTPDMKIDPAGILLHDTLLGERKIKSEDIMEIHAGPGRYQVLTNVKPARLVPPKGVTKEKAMKIQPGDPSSADNSAVILTAADTELSYTVPSGLSIFASRVSVPKDVPASGRVTFAVYGDGQLISKTPPMGPDDPPRDVRVDLGAAGTMALRVEAVAPAPVPPGVSGNWTGPMLLAP